MDVSAAKAACRKSFAPAAASDQVSSRPKRGDRICVVASPAAAQVPDAARARDELADRLVVAALDRLLAALVGFARHERLRG